MQHELKSSPATCHWGYFDARLAPVAEIASGERIKIETLSGAPDVVPDPSAFDVPPELLQVHREAPRPLGTGHILTGPIAVRDARPGDILEIRILDIQLRQDWGYNVIRPLAGALPEDFPERRLLHIRLDRQAMVAKLPWGVDLPLRPFFGVLGVAPPPNWGTLSSIQPRAHGGNLDNKELVAGTTLFLPVWAEGGLLSAGDGHAAQGDGEVCVTAIETALTGTFEIVLHKGRSLALPRAETPTHYITMGMDPDLDTAAKTALREMIALVQERANLSREDAYTLCSIAADLRVTQIVNQEKGIHVMLAKSALHS